jgi:hypothetical protein
MDQSREHMRLVGHPHLSDLRHRVADVGAGNIATRSRVEKCLASASQFDARDEFPVKPCEKAH